MYASEPSTDGHLENLLEHAQDVSLWVAVEICSASSIKVSKTLLTIRVSRVFVLRFPAMNHGIHKVIEYQRI